jgi:hypothetical protein
MKEGETPSRHLSLSPSHTLSLSYNSGAITNATTDISLSRILSEGPDVSLNGSPTVSPTTAALWGSEPL